MALSSVKSKMMFIPATEPPWFCDVSCDIFPPPEFNIDGKEEKFVLLCLAIVLLCLNSSFPNLKTLSYNKSFHQNLSISHYLH